VSATTIIYNRITAGCRNQRFGDAIACRFGENGSPVAAPLQAMVEMPPTRARQITTRRLPWCAQPSPRTVGTGHVPVRIGRGWPAAFVLLSALWLARWTVDLNQPPVAPAATPAGPAEFYQDFRGGKPLHAAWHWAGLSGDEVIVTDDQGVRIKMPLNHARKDPVGLLIASPAKGDFEITTGYELLGTPQPRTGQGVGFELYVMLETPAQEALAFMIVKRPDGTDQYVCNYLRTVDAKRRSVRKMFSASGKVGQLQVSRKGTKFTCAAADGPGVALKELCSYDGDAAEVRQARISAYPGQSSDEVEVRLLDLRLRSDGLNPDLIAKPSPPADAPEDVGGKGWLLVALAIASVIFLALAVTAGIAFFARRRHQPTPAHGSNLVEEPASAIQAEAAPIAFACSGCGKHLKVKVELAGKKVKCPHCGTAVSAQAGEA
jgi:hypothetical protein